MDNRLVVVTGYFGAPLEEEARRIAEERKLPLIDLDKAIETRVDWTISRLVMMHGEHAYRNNEYEILKELSGQNRSAVILCGDGVLHDDDSKAIIAGHELVIVGNELTDDQLWESARLTRGSYHAFMNFGTDEEKRPAFDRLIERQRLLFTEIIKD